MSKIKMNKSAIADVGDFLYGTPCEIGTLHQGKYEKRYLLRYATWT